MKDKRKWGVQLVLGLALAIPLSALAGELGEKFREYQQALESRNKQYIAVAAEAVYRVAEKFPEDNKNYAAATMNYGKALIDVSEYDEAEFFLNKALKSYRLIYGEQDIKVIDPLLELARARAENVGAENRSRYKNYVNDALNVAEEIGGEQSQLYATVNLEAGKISLQDAHDRWARIYLEKAYQAFSGPYKEHERNRFLSAFYLGKYYLARGQYEKSEPLLLEALESVDVSGEGDSQLELSTRAFLVEVYEEMELQEKSIEQRRAIGAATPFNRNQEPKPLFSRGLEYPSAALRAKKEGYAIARFTISDSGLAEDIEILATSGSSSFGTAAKDYLEQARYAPRFVDGEPVSTPGMEMRFHFNLAN